MPEVHIYGLKGPTLDQKRGLVKDLTDAMVKRWKVTDNYVQISFFDVGMDSRACYGKLYVDHVNMENDLTEVQVFAVSGRTVEQRRVLAQDFTAAFVANYGITKDQVVISYIEIPNDAKASHGRLYMDGDWRPPTDAD